jgi:formate--tetrahydrofolate ligase
MKTDIEIANSIEYLPINEVAHKIGINDDELELYGKYKAKINLNHKRNKKGKLILVTSINPTPFGEGKTTMSIGIDDAINKLGYNSIVALREPSLGPVFGIKGGATGGGYAQVVPMEDINLHFTGDIHAITACNNLLCAAIDNHLFQGNSLNINPDTITFKRCLDINDRALRKVIVGNGKNEISRTDGFNISVASEIMAILCISKDLVDLKKRLGNILIGFNYDNEPIYAKDLKISGALTLLLKDAIKPNLVQTLEGNPAIIHGGPFANIAHGCNSIIATKTALSLGDYVVTEAGFGSDLGAEKFLDIKCRVAKLKPDCIVINATIRSLKYNGNCPKEELTKESINYLEKGIDNLKVHIENMKLYTKNIIVCLNKFAFDTDKEVAYVRDYVKELDVEFEICEAHLKGSEGALELARKIINICDKKANFKMLYTDDLSIKDKIETISKNIYHAKEVNYLDNVLDEIKHYEKLGYGNLPVCIAKTQYSITDDPKKLGYPKDNILTVKEVRLSSGAGFIVVLMGSIMTMPGLSKEPAYMNMDIDKNGKISGLF